MNNKMMLHKFRKIAAAAALILLAGSCAKEPSESWQDNELRIIKATQQYYHPNAKPIEPDGSLWLISHTHAGSSAASAVGGYVAIDYTGRTLPISGGYVFRTTDSTTARRLGTFATTTHFAPIFTLDTTSLQHALFEAYRRLHVGDTIEIMSASWHAFGSEGSASWSGEGSLPANTPIIFRIILREIAPNPKARELEMVENYVASRPEFVKAKNHEGEELEGFYISRVDTVPLDTALRLDSAAHYATNEDRVSVKYAGYYLQDNFLLDTNIDSVATKRGWSITTTDSTFFTYDFTADASNTEVIKAMHLALLNVAPGSWVEAVFTSDYAYGSEGDMRTTLRPVYHYTPLRFRIYVGKIKAKE